MIPVPCNERSKYKGQDGCDRCNIKLNVRMEHYFTCPGFQRLRRYCNVEENCMNGSIHELKKTSMFMNSVAKLIV